MIETLQNGDMEILGQEVGPFYGIFEGFMAVVKVTFDCFIRVAKLFFSKKVTKCRIMHGFKHWVLTVLLRFYIRAEVQTKVHRNATVVKRKFE